MIKRLTISIEEEFAEEIRRIAKAQGVPVSKVVSQALKEWLLDRRRREKGQKVLEVIRAKGGKAVDSSTLEVLRKMRREADRDWS